MECSQCFPSQLFVVLTISQFVEHSDGPLRQQKQDSHVYQKTGTLPKKYFASDHDIINISESNKIGVLTFTLKVPEGVAHAITLPHLVLCLDLFEGCLPPEVSRIQIMATFSNPAK